MNLKNWIEAARLRTLPLSMSGILIGSSVAYKQDFWDARIFVLALLTTLFWQILSNFANDLGDSFKGTDNDQRLGPKRGMQLGAITQKQMVFGIVIVSVLSLCTVVPLILIGTQGMHGSVLWVYITLAFLSVVAAITYTVGKKAYGYHGLGDLMVFIFFGLVSVIGVYCLYSKQFDAWLIALAFTIGLLSIAVLNLNNMRDHENDKESNKKTLVVILGLRNAKIYHTLIIAGSFIGLLLFIGAKEWWWSAIALLPYIVLLKHVITVWRIQSPKDFDPEMKKVALSTFMIAILFLISTIV